MVDFNTNPTCCVIFFLVKYSKSGLPFKGPFFAHILGWNELTWRSIDSQTCRQVVTKLPLSKKIARHRDIAHPFGNPPATPIMKGIPAEIPVGKGCSECVPKVCWNNLRPYKSSLFVGLKHLWFEELRAVETRQKTPPNAWTMKCCLVEIGILTMGSYNLNYTTG